MSFGHASEVQRNSVHEAIFTKSTAPVVEAYQSVCPMIGAASDRWDVSSCQLLPWAHSVQFESYFVSPFQASLNALSLQWDVCLDNLSYSLQPFASMSSRCAVGATVLNLSQRPHSSDVHTRHVRFDDQIDIYLGNEDDIAMGKIQVPQTALSQWPDKPWSRKRIRKQTSALAKTSPLLDGKQPQEPYLGKNMLSRDCFSSNAETTHHDATSLVQALTFKQTAYSDQEVDMAAMFGAGRTIPDDFVVRNDHTEGSRHEGGESESPISRTSTDSRFQPPSSEAVRQEVIMFHVGDLPLRVFLDWSNYENMINEIAHHYATNVANVIDAYEINAEVNGLPPSAIPIIVHLFPDIAVGQSARLVLFDLEFHAHHTEAGFRAGPRTQRFVLAVPEHCDRATILVLVDVDRYCARENDRCFVWHNTVRWQDTDLLQRHLTHGDLIRIAIPPTERYDCPTTQIVRWTQDGLSDAEILDFLAEREAGDGYSPSLLADDEVRALAVPRNDSDGHEENEHDAFQAMQTSLNHPKAQSVESLSSDEDLPEDWNLDLKRIVGNIARRCATEEDIEFSFTIYTWFLDHDKHLLCREPKIVTLGADPTDWREDILQPWRFWIESEEKVFLDIVKPNTPRSHIEEHLAHIIITQRHADKSSVLLSMEFTERIEPSVFIRVATVLPKVCTQSDVAAMVPILFSFRQNPMVWENPVLLNSEQEFPTWSGLCLKVQIQPCTDAESDAESQEDGVGLIQMDSTTHGKSPLDFPSSKNDIQCDSLTDEFIQAVEAARHANQQDPVPIDPLSIDAQPAAFREIWDRFSTQMDVSVPPVSEVLRIESWFLHHTTHTKCHASRITLLSADFTRWRSQLAATWQDRVQDNEALVFVLVSPEPEDSAAGTIAQLVITEGERAELRSAILSVYDSEEDAARNPYTFALSLPRRINLYRLVAFLQLQTDCPPSNIRNLCKLWFGSLAAYRLDLSTKSMCKMAMLSGW